MGRRDGVGAQVVLVALAALGVVGCGGGDGEEAELDEAEPILAIDPCSLLDADEASRLSGVEVERADAPTGGSLASVIGCSYQPRDDADGAAIAASLVLGGTDEAEPEAAVDARVAELTGGSDEDAEVIEADLGDASVVVTTTTVVHVVYVVDDVVVSVEVTPVDGVDEAAADEVKEFAETTVEPVEQAIEQRGGEASVQSGEIEGLWTGDWGTMAIEEDDGVVRAAYTHDDGRITGTFADGVFTGRWTELPTRAGPSDAGPVEFRFTKGEGDTIALDGRWSYDSDAEPLSHDDWDLTLSEEEVPEDLLAAFEDDESFAG